MANFANGKVQDFGQSLKVSEQARLYLKSQGADDGALDNPILFTVEEPKDSETGLGKNYRAFLDGGERVSH